MTTPHRSSKPLYRRVADDLAARIDAGDLEPADKLPSERALCEQHGVSQITVRRALRELAHEGRVYSRHGLGWFVSARAGAGRSSPNVTLILPELDWLTGPLVCGLSDELGPTDVALGLAFTGGEPGRQSEALASAASRGSDALLLIVAGQERDLSRRYARLLERASCPVVLLRHEVAGIPASAAVLDEQQCMAELAQHILDLGHLRVAYAGPDPSLVEGQRRYRGFASTLWERGLELPLEWIFSGALGAGSTAARFRSVFEQTDYPTALVCASDMHAAEAMALLHDLDLECPDDVALVGLGDREFAPFLPTPLTSFRLDLPGLARGAASMLVDLLAERPVRSVRVSGQVITRQSCGAGLMRPAAEGAPGSEPW